MFRGARKVLLNIIDRTLVPVLVAAVLPVQVQIFAPTKREIALCAHPHPEIFDPPHRSPIDDDKTTNT